MSGSTFLQIFLLLNVFVIGALSVLAIQHAIAHFRPHQPEPPKQQPHPLTQTAHLPPEVRERLLEAAKANYQTVLNRSAEMLQHDLTATADRLNKQLEKLGTEVATSEMQRYRTELDQLRKQTEVAIGDAQADLTTHQTDLKAKLAEEMAAEKQALLKQIDTKLADAVASFLLDTLQHNVDLGAQSSYLSAVLEEHKADFAREVTDETQATK